MNKNTLPQTTHKEFKFIPILIIVSIVALLIAAILKVLTPPSKVVVQSDFATNNYNGSRSKFKKINFSGTDISIPEQFFVYQQDTSISLAQDLAQRLITEYGLVQDTRSENYWLNGSTFLNYSEYDKRYSFTLEANPPEEAPSIILSEAIQKCQDFYAKYNLKIALKADGNDVLYLADGLEHTKVDAKSATIFQIPFTYDLGGYKLFHQNENNYPFLCRVNNNYDIAKIVFKDTFHSLTPKEELPSISLDEALKNIESGKASIIDAESQIVDIIDLNLINEAELYSVEIEYRYDDVLKIAYPFYKFKARLVNAGGINIQATIITPAVATAVEK